MTGSSRVSETRRAHGPRRAGSLLSAQIRAAGESRGFGATRVLTHWAEIAGDDIARVTRPVEVTFGKGFGATLTLLCAGAHAPMIEMQKERLREKVNACYGYNAISRIRITQTSATGFADPQTAFVGRPHETPPEIAVKARGAVDGVGDESLRAALEALGRNILTKQRST